MNKTKNVLIAPISFLSKALFALLTVFKQAVYFRGRLDQEVLTPEPNDDYDRASDAFRTFTDVNVRKEDIEAIARRYGCDAAVLGKFSRDVMMHAFHFDFCFLFSAARKLSAASRITGFVSFPPFWWKDLGELCGYKTNRFLSTFLLLERRCLFLLKATLKMFFFTGKVFSWLFPPARGKGSGDPHCYIWLSGDTKAELVKDVNKNSLPCFLAQLRAEGNIPQRFLVVAPALKREEWWEDEHVVIRSHVWDLPLDVTCAEGRTLVRQFLRLFLHLLACLFSARPDFEILYSLAEYLFVDFVLNKMKPPAVFYSQSTFGAANSLVYASAERNIPAFLIYYGATNFRPAVESPASYQLTTCECQNIIADHIFVWNEHTRQHFASIGRKENVHVVGAQIFAPLYPPQQTRPESKLTIGVFFGVPFAKEQIYRIGLGNYFHDIAYCADFWRSLFSVAAKVYHTQFTLLVKLKMRSNNQAHYDTWFRSLEKAYSFFDDVVHVCSETENLWNVVARTDGCISTPLSSAAGVPLACGIPSVHYDHASIVQPLDGLGIPLIRGEAALADWLRGIRKGGNRRMTTPGKRPSYGVFSFAQKLNTIIPSIS